ncbi:MAG: hypothetical protein ACFCUI_01860 [Bernardetiaceae bacterium]
MYYATILFLCLGGLLGLTACQSDTKSAAMPTHTALLPIDQSFDDFWRSSFSPNLAEQHWDILQKNIHPTYGFLLIGQISYIPFLKQFKQLSSVSEEIPQFLEGLQLPEAELVRYPAQTNGLFSDEHPAIYCVSESPKNLLQARLQAIQVQAQNTVSEADLSLAKTFDRYPLQQVILRECFCELVFANIENKWYLVFFNQFVPESEAQYVSNR